MRRTLLLMGLAGAVAASPPLANAQPFPFGSSCWGHRVGGTVLGGVGGGAIGAALAAGVAVTPWAWAAAGVGALIGHTIGVAACRRHWREAYYDHYYAYPPPPPYAVYHPAYGYYDAGYHDYVVRHHPTHHYVHVVHHHPRHVYDYAVEHDGRVRG